MSRLAEAYFHLKPFKVSEDEMQRLGREVSSIAAAAALSLFEPECEIEVRLESGSLKGRAQVIGGIALLAYGTIAEYKDFREGVGLLVEDAQKFGGAVIEKSLEVAHVTPQQVFRVERRKKTPGKILKLLRRREWLRAHRSQLAPDAIAQELKAIGALDREVLADLEPEEQRVFEKVIRDDEAPDAPAKEPEPEAVEERRKQPGHIEGPPDLFTVQLPPVSVSTLAQPDFYARFRLGEWARQPLGNLPQPPVPERQPPSNPQGQE